MMTYLILHEGKAFYTEWFMAENNFVEGMTVFNLDADTFTTDGEKWQAIEFDHL